METWTTVDKEGWGFGPWQDEPDKAVWVDEATGLDCMIFRHPSGGHLCGYVGVPPDHPYHGIAYNQCPLLVRGGNCPENEEKHFCEHEPTSRLPSHGGLTFAEDCQEPTREEWEGDETTDLPFAEWKAEKMPRRICHVPEEGRPDDVWWFGFDCAHLGDVSPGYDRRSPDPRSTYRSLAYVKGQVEKLAAELATVEEADAGGGR